MGFRVFLCFSWPISRIRIFCTQMQIHNFGAKKKIEEKKSKEGKESLIEIVSMLVGLTRANSPDRRV